LLDVTTVAAVPAAGAEESGAAQHLLAEATAQGEGGAGATPEVLAHAAAALVAVHLEAE
jgi:hypothetical protein